MDITIYRPYTRTQHGSCWNVNIFSLKSVLSSVLRPTLKIVRFNKLSIVADSKTMCDTIGLSVHATAGGLQLRSQQTSQQCLARLLFKAYSLYTSSLCMFVLYGLPGFLPLLMLYYFHKEFSCSYGYTNFCVVSLGRYHDGRIWGTIQLYPHSFYNNRCFTYKLVVTSCTVLEEGRQNVSFWLGTQVNGLAVAPDCIIVFSFFKENIAFVFNWLSPFKRCLKNKCL